MKKTEFIKRYGTEAWERLLKENRLKKARYQQPKVIKNKLKYIQFNSSAYNFRKHCFNSTNTSMLIVSGADYKTLTGTKIKQEIIKLLNIPNFNFVKFVFHASRTLRKLRWTLCKKSKQFEFFTTNDLITVLHRMLTIEPTDENK